MASRRLVTLTRTNPAVAERAAEILSELDEWFEVTARGDGFASVDVGGHIFDPEEAARQVVARLDEIDASWRESLSVGDPQLSSG